MNMQTQIQKLTNLNFKLKVFKICLELGGFLRHFVESNPKNELFNFNLADFHKLIRFVN